VGKTAYGPRGHHLRGYGIEVRVTPRRGILDPRGKTVGGAAAPRRNVVRFLVPLLAAAAAVGCGGAGDEERRETAVAGRCESRPGGSRWDAEYQRSAVFGDSEAEAIGGIVLAGIAATDSVVYVMESGRARLWLLRPDLSVIRSVGREGRGPGEWHPFGPANQGGSMRWVSASDRAVRLFDGERIQEFAPDGRFRRIAVNGALATGISPLQSRVRYAGDHLLFSAGGYDIMLPVATGGAAAARRADPVDGRSQWWVKIREGDADRAVLQLGLLPLPPKAGIGPAQALPLWDASGGCVVATDGAGPLLIAASVQGGGQDTLQVPLPDRRADPRDFADDMAGVLPPGVRLDRPSAPTRVRDLALDPDGYVWLLPVQPKPRIPGGVEVIRVGLADGRNAVDTVPAFPRAFGPPGVFYGERHGSGGEILVERYERRGG
jgi:hypothetical protein